MWRRHRELLGLLWCFYCNHEKSRTGSLGSQRYRRCEPGTSQHLSWKQRWWATQSINIYQMPVATCNWYYWVIYMLFDNITVLAYKHHRIIMSWLPYMGFLEYMTFLIDWIQIIAKDSVWQLISSAAEYVARWEPLCSADGRKECLAILEV